MPIFINVNEERREEFFIEKPETYVFFLFNLSGNLKIELDVKDCKVYVFGVFIGKGKENFELKTIQHHRIGNNFSELLIKGVFFDESRFLYEGLIRIDKGADKAHAYQKNQNLSLSPKCFVESRPFLEILANDVYCTHGSTTGKLSEEQIYYLETRGFSRKKAKFLLIQGFIGEVFDMVSEIIEVDKVNFLRKEILKKIPKR